MRLRRMSNRRAVQLLADELNQFAMAVEDYADRQRLLEETLHGPNGVQHAQLLFKAARRFREQIAELIPR